MRIEEVPINKIKTIYNIRRIETTESDIAGLAESMEANGQAVEIRVFQDNGHYVLKAGHRRLAAASMLGWETIRAVVSPPPEDRVDLLLSQYNENEHRKGMTYMEKAAFYQSLKDEGVPQSRIARLCGVSDTDVSLALAALEADPHIQKALDEKRISHSAVEPVLALPVEDQGAIADAVLAAKTVRKVAGIVRAHKMQKSLGTPARQEDIDPEIDPLEIMALNELDEALRLVRSASSITHPELRRQALPKVKELVALAKRLLKEQVQPAAG